MNSSENIQGKKLLVISCKNTELYLSVTEDSEIIKNPIPILWNLEGMYGWIPVEVVKNEISRIENMWCLMPAGFIQHDELKLTWHQTYQLRQDVGRLLEELGK